MASQSPKERMAQALLAVPPGDPTPSGPPPDPINAAFLPDPRLEQAAQVQSGAPPLHPLVRAIMQHMGLLNLVRNQHNQALIDPEAPVQ